MEVAPWFALRHHVFHPLTHPDVGCPKGGAHDYVVAGGDACARCGHALSADGRRELDAYRATFPRLFDGLRAAKEAV